MKKIFIFKPAKVWAYCGGGRAIVADSFDEAAKYFPDDVMCIGEEEADIRSKQNYGHTWDSWVLVATFGLTGDPAEGVVLDDSNWG